jgi:UDP-N-acetylmuramoylalanine--D-glutamate ligase
MELKHLQDKTILVVGLGESGLAMVRFCLRSGARVIVLDTRENPSGLENLPEGAVFKSGGLQDSALDGVDAVVYSPGLSPNHEPLKSFVIAASARGLAFDGELELFANALAQLKSTYSYAPKIVAVTGTNGKTTVVQLCAHLINASGKYAVAAGNVSPAAVAALCDALDSDQLPDVWVLELSSFQLMGMHSLVIDAATILNITEDHLDWHVDMDDYRHAKQQIYTYAKAVVVNRADKATEPVARVLVKSVTEDAPVMHLSFNTDEPRRFGDFGLVSLNGLPWLAEAVAADDEIPLSATAKKKRDKEERAWRMNRLIPLDTLKLKGTHNYANVLAALALCRAIGIAQAKTLRAVQTYAGEAHRCQWIRSLDGVDYFDDSKGTNVGATVAALESLGSGLNRPIVLIAGGDGKGQDFSVLQKVFARTAKQILLIGKDAAALAKLAEKAGVAFEVCDSLEQAVSRAHAVAQADDIVLLSPACASLDMFKNYRHRAQVFVTSVSQLVARPEAAPAVEAVE